MTNLTIHVVRRTVDDQGTAVRIESTDLPNHTPQRISRRGTMAHRIGLDYVRSLNGTDTDVVAVTVSTTLANRGRMALASWRNMPTLTTDGHATFTGTHDLHPLVAERMRGLTFGQWLNRRETA